ncbi:MAG: (2,3-dihydroxybenzoyl)adenylate synthase, partial [Deltaproteobacteria bacterium]|nr:(2,3-dihydroxybenzoyl)adenylate synthase [Deltaproteobacteria bacterium]
QNGVSFSLEELQKYLIQERQIAKFKVPERLEFIDAFPETKIGKLDKKALREKIIETLKDEGND